MPDDSGEKLANRGIGVGPFIGWLAVSGLGLTFLTIVSVHAPNRIKLLGLFAGGYGLLAGLWMGRLARATRVRCGKSVAVFSFLLVALGMLGMALQSCRIHADAITRQYTINIPMHLAGTGGVVTDPDTQAQLRQILQASGRERSQKLTELTSFDAYLSYRTVGDQVHGHGWPAPWPWMLWSLEVLLAGVVGVCCTLRVAAPLIDELNAVR